MPGATEYGKCEKCGTEGPLQRTYFRYDVRCTCHSPHHFELVRHCSTCVPIEPEYTKIEFHFGDHITLKTSSLKKSEK